MKKSRKFLSILIALSLTLMLLPATVFAADTHKVAIHRHGSGMGTADAEGVVSNKYYLVNYDGSLKSEDANEDNYNIYYDEASNHLTLNKLYISTEGMLLVPGGTTIEVIGFNMISQSATSTGGGIGVVSDGNLTITGSGQLWIESSIYSGISRTNPDNAYSGVRTTGDIQINGSVQLTILHRGAASCISPNNGNVVIGGSAEVSLNPNAGTDRDNGSITNFNAGDITIQEDATVTSNGSIDTPGKVKVDGSSTLTISPFEESGVDLRGSGGVEVAEGATLNVNSWTKSGQAIAAGDGTIKIAGETNVSMLNDSPAGNIALYAQSIEVTGKLIARGGTNGLQAKGGNTVSFNGADVKLFDYMIGVASKAEITNSLLEFDTKLKAFNSTTTAALTDDYAVFAGTDVNNAEFISRGSDGVESGVWGRAYVRTEEHTCTYDQQVESDDYLLSAADCDSPAVYYKSCVCGAKGTETFTVGTESGHDWGNPVWNWSEDGKTAAVTFTCQNDNAHTQSPKVTITSEVKTSATCTEMGTTTYTATVTFNGQEYTSTKDVVDIA